MPTIIQTIIYRKKNNGFELLLLKRSPERGGFWNAVNGTMEAGETIVECRKRELFEEAGIQEVFNLSDEIYRFNFVYNGKEITVIVFTAEVAEDQEIIINDEHTEYRWVGLEEGTGMLKYEDDKKALRICWDRLKE